MQDLVTILTPCYNGTPYLKRFLDSILSQTYGNIEIIFVDDGSTDGTKAMFYSYEDKFKNKGYSSKYIYQNNAGQAAAINNGLKHVTGKFLAWPDSDDELTESSIEERVAYLLANPDTKVVLSQAKVVDNDTGDLIGIFRLKYDNLDDRDLVRAYVSEQGIYVTNGCYLIDFASFKEANKGVEILTSRAGQNWQMLLPMARDYSFAYIAKPLYTYYVRSDSHSHGDDGNKQLSINKVRKHKLLLYEILKDLGILDRYKKYVDDSYLAKKLVILAKFNDKRVFNDTFETKKRTATITSREIVMWLLMNTNSIGLMRRLRLAKITITKHRHHFSLETQRYKLFKVRQFNSRKKR